MRPQTPQLRANALNNPTIDRAMRGQKGVQGKALTRGLGASSPQRLFLFLFVLFVRERQGAAKGAEGLPFLPGGTACPEHQVLFPVAQRRGR